MSDLIALVSGGSGGIGAATCRALAANGVSVLVGFRDGADRATDVATSCEGAAEPVHLDVGDDDSVAAAVAQAQAMGRLGILVNAAGVADDDLVLRTDADRFAATVATNLTGTYRLTQAALRPMLRARWGRIVTVSSIVALRGNAGQVAYSAAKAGLIGMTRSLAREVARKGITVNAVAPGFVPTAMTDALPAEVRDEHVARTPLGRAVTTDEVAAAIRFLASEDAGAITGVVLPIDGGAAI